MTLIERLEQATEGSRELDAAIADAAHGLPAGWVTHPHKYGTPYTTSIDAALTLVPEGCISWSIGDTPGGATAWLFYDLNQEFDGIAATPALAICRAALKAREANNG